MDSEKYKKIQDEVTGRMNSKRFVALLIILLSAIACVYVGVKTTSYYLLVVFGALIVYYLYEFCSYTSLLKNGNYIITDLTCEESQRSHLGYDMISSKIFRFKINKINNEPAKSFYDKKIFSKALLTGIGYKELYRYFEGEISLEEAIDLIKKNSRHYAKRQYTWFNHQMNVKWFNTNYEDFSETIAEVEAYIDLEEKKKILKR